MITICAFLGFLSLWLGIRQDPFEEMLNTLRRIAKKRLETFWKPFAPLSADQPFSGHLIHAYHEAQDSIEASLAKAHKEQERQKKLIVCKKQRHLHTAKLCENLERELDRVMCDFKEEIRDISQVLCLRQ